MSKNFLKLFLLVALIPVGKADAQQKSRYTTSGGLLGGGNFSALYKADGPSNVSYKSRFGYQFGGWVNFALSKTFSLEPQFQYIRNEYIPDGSPAGILAGHTSSLAIPLLLKIHAGKNFAFSLGPELAFITNLKEDNNNYSKDDLAKTTHWYGSAGLEIFPHKRVTLYGRYLYGFNDFISYGAPTVGFSNYRPTNVQFGLKLKLFGHKVEAAAAVVPAVVAPVVVEPAKPKDTDGDGIIDAEDKCPTVAGLAKYQGCPIPDTDGDGINDEEDKCPSVAGLAKYQGCPIPDTDGDGVNDEEDLCPKTPGIAANKGCPELVLYYKRDVDALNAEDKAELDKVVKFLNDHPDVKILLEGHTSTLGADAYNLKLSDRRAANSKAYLVQKGIAADRIRTVGLGEQFPIGDNSTEAGRAASRRVVIKADQ